jgi:ABC-2 type transport system permease protein
MNSEGLWKERFFGFSKEIQKYLRYIFNGHLVFVMVIGLGGVAYYYSEWVKTLTSEFPAELIMAFVLAIVLTRSPILTFLKEADTIFLLPLETKLQGYFTKSIILSLVLQTYLLLFIFAAFMPMFAKVTGADFTDFWLLMLIMIMVKYLNLRIHWHVLKFQERLTVNIDGCIRFLLNAVLLYLLFVKANTWFSILIILLLAGLLSYYRQAVKDKALKWERLVELEGKRMMAFYRVANLFTDVPKLRGKVARRKYLDWIVSFVPYKQNKSYLFLYARTMLRANDYAGLLIRLTFIGSFVLAAFVSIWASVLVTVFVLYITGIQLLPVWKQHELKIWVSLYPLPDILREKAVIQLVSYFLLFETVLFFIVLLVLGNWMAAVASIVAGMVFILIFKNYAAKKLKSF